MNKKALMYRRVSTEGQVEKYGLPTQENAIREYCDKNSIILIDGKDITPDGFTDGGITGVMDDDDDDLLSRKGLHEMFKYLSAHSDIKNIIVFAKSRLWRNEDAKVFITRRLRKMEVDIISVCEPTYSIFEKVPKNKLINTILDGIDECEKSEITEKLAKSRTYKALQTHTKPAGILPFGYMYSRNKKNVIVDEAEAIVVRLIFGNAAKKIGYQEIANILNSKGYLTRRNNPWTKQTIRAILSNDFYISVLSYKQKVKGTHPAIISTETWKVVNPKYTLAF